MAFSKGKDSITLEELGVDEWEILSYYLNVYKIPCVIHSPLRKDNHPSFGLYSKNGKRIYYKDFTTNESGGLFDLLGIMWNTSFEGVLNTISKDVPNIKKSSKVTYNKSSNHNISNNRISNSKLECKIRNWEKHDIDYWKSYGINYKWLQYAEVFPISHKIIVKDGKKCIFKADKYAYAFVEHKENNTTLKIYQPFNKNGYKWNNKHDMSVISLWTKIPKKGDNICICSSLKDALCLWSNVSIPAIAVQGEGYSMSITAQNELRKRFKNIYVLFDNDEAGIKNGIRLSKETGFKNIVLPNIGNAKDISDLYKYLSDKEKFINIIKKLFN